MNAVTTPADALADGGLALLREGRVDLAITAGGDLREFEVTELAQERFFLVCPQGHALAARRSVSLAQLEGQPMVHLARETGVAYIAAGHHATERFGVQALGEAIAAHFGIGVRYLDVDSPV